MEDAEIGPGGDLLQEGVGSLNCRGRLVGLERGRCEGLWAGGGLCAERQQGEQSEQDDDGARSDGKDHGCGGGSGGRCGEGLPLLIAQCACWRRTKVVDLLALKRARDACKEQVQQGIVQGMAELQPFSVLRLSTEGCYKYSRTNVALQEDRVAEHDETLALASYNNEKTQHLRPNICIFCCMQITLRVPQRP